MITEGFADIEVTRLVRVKILDNDIVSDFGHGAHDDSRIELTDQEKSWAFEEYTENQIDISENSDNEDY